MMVFRLRGEWFLPARQAHKRVDTCGFHPLVNLPFPLRVWRRLLTCDRCEAGERQRIFSTVSFVTYSQRQIDCCYTDRLLSAGAAYPCRAIRERVMIDRAYAG